jgi:hypothetical protein
MPTKSPIPNEFDLVFPPDDLKSCQDSLETLDSILSRLLINISADDVRGLAKFGPRNNDFIYRAMAIIRAMPEYKPGFLDLDAFQRDLDAITLLAGLLDKLRKCFDLVEDSMMVAGSEGYQAALAIYAALKSAARLGSNDAQVAVDDLAQRLPQRKARPVPTPAGGGSSGTASTQKS